MCKRSRLEELVHDLVIRDDEEVKEEVDPMVLTLRISSDLSNTRIGSDEIALLSCVLSDLLFVRDHQKVVSIL